MKRKTKQPVKINKEEQMFEKIMTSIEDSISFGVYAFLKDMNNFIKSAEKRRKRCKNIINQHRIQNKHKPTDIKPGIAMCEHGIYECPECAKKRRGKNARKNLS